MILKDILTHIKPLSIHGNTGVDISGITQDSRRVEQGFLYIAIAGNVSDGHEYIDEAIIRGASAIVCDTMPQRFADGVAYMSVADTKQAIGPIADLFYDHPSKKLTLLGVTGTNGKTTTATLLYEIIEHAGYKAGLISTVENKIHDKIFAAERTTPDPVELRRLLGDMVNAGCTHAAMEVSSHALHQHRVDGLVFAAGVFTNLTQDHLDYHGTMEKYLLEKKKLFDMLPPDAFAVMNADDAAWQKLAANSKATVVSFSMHDITDVKSDIVGSAFSYKGETYTTTLPGQYNIANALGVIVTLLAVGFSPIQIKDGLAAARGARGRFEAIKHPEGAVGIIDYAHTPDGVENVLQAIANLKQSSQKIITVIGCGGNRDTAKRPLMLAAALKYSDIVIGTSDNPRQEDPKAILVDMEAALSGSSKIYERIIDRAQAIDRALALAHPGDIVALLGKGHEAYQEIGATKQPFSDATVFLHAKG